MTAAAAMCLLTAVEMHHLCRAAGTGLMADGTRKGQRCDIAKRDDVG